MTAEFKSSTVTNMDIDDNKVGYKQLLEDGMPKFRNSVYVVRNSPFKVATVCLGLLCVLLLAAVIGQSVHYRSVEKSNEVKEVTMNKEKDNLQESLRSAQKQKRDFEVSHNQLQQRYDFLSKKRDQIQTNNKLLIEQANKNKADLSQLQASAAASNKELEQLKATKTTLETANNALTQNNKILQNSYDTTLNTKKDLEVRLTSVTKERDNLQNKFNNATRSKEQLQMNYNTLIQEIEHLQGRYNFSSSEKDKIESSHKNVTTQKDLLQVTYNLLVNATEELRASYNSLIKEKKELESTCKNATEERDLARMKNDNLTAERDQLKADFDRLNIKIQGKNCPTGWKKFEGSCYFTSVSQKSWSQSREYCKGKGGDLAIVTSKEEMDFINTLYGSDKEVWIGLTDKGVEGQWQWVDGTPMTKTFWASGQPNSYNGRDQDCVEFWHRATRQGEWNDENCNLEQNWICEMSVC